MNKKKKIIISITSVILICLILVGITYAFFLTNIKGNNTHSVNVSTAYIDLIFTDKTSNVNVSNIVPITSDKVLSQAKVKTFTVSKKDNTDDAYVNLYLSDINLTENFANYDFKWALYQDGNKVSTGDFGGKTSGSIVLATNQFIDSNVGKTYDLYIWINESGLRQDMMTGGLTAKIDGTVTASPLKTLSSLLLGENKLNVQLSQFNYSNDFTCTALEDGICTANYVSGLYEQSGDINKSEMGFPTYYFRGNVKNNYVSFAGLSWRVVRINEDGSVKLITDQAVLPDDLWGEKTTNYLTSYVRNKVLDWYNINIASDENLDSKVVMSSFCNDVSEYFTAANSRLNNNAPSFVCSSGANIEYNKAALITADEVYFSGVLRQNSLADNTIYSYLYDNEDHGRTYTMTPGTETTSIVFYKNRLQRQQMVGKNSVRVVINLSADAVVSDGDGLSPESAFVIE